MELPTSSSSWFKDFMGAAGLDISAGKPPHKAPIGPPMTLDNMRMNGVRDLLVICLTHRCEHNATFNVDAYPGELPVKWFEPRIGNAIPFPALAKARGNHEDRTMPVLLVPVLWAMGGIVVLGGG
jgi:hypothetical protein